LMAEDSLRTKIPGFEWLKNGPRLRPDRIAYIGCRDLDAAERREMRAKKILCFTMFEIDKYGIGTCMQRALDFLGNRPLHLSYDIDAVDPEHAPSTGTIVRGGFNFREAHFIAEAIAETNRLCSMDLVEINPSLNTGGSTGSMDETIQLGLALTLSAVGQRIL